MYICNGFRELHRDIDMPKRHNTLDLLNAKVAYTNGSLILKFKHKMEPENDDDASFLKKCFYLMCPIEGGELARENEIGKPKRKPLYSDKKICFTMLGIYNFCTTVYEVCQIYGIVP